MTRLQRILELARWAPSGDNSQPWRFEIRSPRHVVVHGLTGQLGVYDLAGTAAEISIGALLETLRIAASAECCRISVSARPQQGAQGPLIDVWLNDEPAPVADPLHAAIRTRSVQRKPLEIRPLDAVTKAALEGSLGEQFRLVWFEGWRARLRLAWLAVRSAKIRLTIPEAYEVHRRIIEWDARFSDDRIPDQALGADALSVRSMRWVLASWPRVQRMNRYCAGTWWPRLQFEFLPGLRCAAHFALIADAPPRDLEARLRAGAAAQRFWLTATHLGLQLQPQHTPLMFAGYARDGVRFSESERARTRAAQVARRLDALLGADAAPRTVFLGRIGHGPAAGARSLRLPLERLMVAKAAVDQGLESSSRSEP
jgi:nitroreductase